LKQQSNIAKDLLATQPDSRKLVEKDFEARIAEKVAKKEGTRGEAIGLWQFQQTNRHVSVRNRI